MTLLFLAVPLARDSFDDTCQCLVQLVFGYAPFRATLIAIVLISGTEPEHTAHAGNRSAPSEHDTLPVSISVINDYPTPVHINNV
mgnify:CR=1 FL=1